MQGLGHDAQQRRVGREEIAEAARARRDARATRRDARAMRTIRGLRVYRRRWPPWRCEWHDGSRIPRPYERDSGGTGRVRAHQSQVSE